MSARCFVLLVRAVRIGAIDGARRDCERHGNDCLRKSRTTSMRTKVDNNRATSVNDKPSGAPVAACGGLFSFECGRRHGREDDAIPLVAGFIPPGCLFRRRSLHLLD
jgi:hypothetical protein